MSYNNVNQQFGPRVPPGAESIPKTAATDFQTGQATGSAREIPSAESKQSQQPSNAKAEERLENEGHLPGLSDVQNDNEKNLRQPGQDDAAGNKIHHKGLLRKMLHWEHSGMNAD